MTIRMPDSPASQPQTPSQQPTQPAQPAQPATQPIHEGGDPSTPVTGDDTFR
jgi:hypothetical protein